jgi:hypothetical protein
MSLSITARSPQSTQKETLTVRIKLISKQLSAATEIGVNTSTLARMWIIER